MKMYVIAIAALLLVGCDEQKPVGTQAKVCTTWEEWDNPNIDCQEHRPTYKRSSYQEQVDVLPPVVAEEPEVGCLADRMNVKEIFEQSDAKYLGNVKSADLKLAALKEVMVCVNR